MTEDTAFFEAQAVTHARTLAVPDARRFLRGLLESVADDQFPRTREAYGNLCFALDQLEVIASGRMKLAREGPDLRSPNSDLPTSSEDPRQ